MAGYTRQNSADITSGSTVRAAPINSEFNQVRDAFSEATGHKHDGTSAEGPIINMIGDSGATAINKVQIDETNNKVSFYSNVNGGSVAQVHIADGKIEPETDNDIDLGSSAKGFKNLYLDGAANVGSISVATATISGGNVNGTAVGASTPSTGAFTTVSSSGQATLASADINGGTVDNSIIGASTPAAASFTTVSSSGQATLNSADINGGTIDGSIIGASTAAAASFTTISSSGQATLASADINGGTIDGAVIGGATPAAVTGTTVTANNGFNGVLSGNVTGNLTGNVTGNLTGDVTGDVTGNLTASSGTTTVNNLTVNGTVDFTNTALTNLAAPSNASDAATKSYVDTEVSNLVDSAPGALNTLNELATALGDDANFSTTITNSVATKLPLAGGTMTGDIAMGSNTVTGLAAPSSGTDAATKTYVDTATASNLAKAGGTMTGALAMSSNKITGLGTPTAAADATTKDYVDGILGSTTAAATSATNAATSATNAATSATNAANSATAAAASFDAFDDKFLGSKNTSGGEPTVDNDGDALSAGVLYWDNTNSRLRIYNGSAWESAAVSAATIVEKSGSTMTGDLAFGDNDKAIFGAGSDLQIYHDSLASYIVDSGTGSLNIHGTDINLKDADGNSYINMSDNGTGGTVTIRHNTAVKLNTKTDGVLITGELQADSLDINGSGDISGNLSFADNGKAIFGAGSDLQIYHDASESIIEDVGTGDLKVRGSDEVKIQVRNAANTAWLNAVVAADAGAVTLSHNNSAKLATTNTGVDVTGTVTADGLTVDTDTLYVDSTNNRVGIVNASPSTPLDVVGTGQFTNTSAGASATAIKLQNLDNTIGSATSLDFAPYGNGTVTDRIEGGHDGSNKFSLRFHTYSSGLAERLRIDGDGNVGIGMTNPNSYGRLAVMTPTTGYGYFGIGNSVGGGGGVNIGSYYGTTKISYIDTVLENGTPSSEQSRIQFATISGGTLAERMRITAAGAVGIGTQSPSTILDVEGANINFASSENGILNVFSNDATAVDKGGSISLGGNSESGSLGFAMIKGAKQSTDAGYLAFGTRSAAANSTEHMRLDSGGKLNVNNTTGSARVNISADNWPENALALYSAGIAGQTNFAGMGFFNQDADSPIGQVADIYTNPTGTLSLTASGNPAIQLKYGSFGISGGTPALTVDNAGRIGIGTTAPTLDGSLAGLSVNASGTVVHVNNGNGATLKLTDPATGANRGLGISLQNTEAVISNCESGSLRFGTGNAERFRINSNGDVGIGRSDPENIVGTSGGGLVIRSGASRAATTALFAVQSSNNYNMLEHLHNGQFKLRNSSNTQTLLVDTSGNLTATGNVTAYSDERLKSDITTIDNALDKVQAMRGVTFTKDGEAGSGVIAQELEKIAPELVMEGEEYKSVAYGNLVGYLIEAVKELSAKVEALENGSSK